MNRTLALIVGLLLLAAPARAQSPDDIQSRLSEAIELLTSGNELLKAGKRDQANAHYDRAVQLYAGVLEEVEALPVPAEAKDEVRQLALYNSACARSLQDRKDEALDLFGQALESGFSDFDLIAKDSDLENIRSQPRFAQLLERARARLAEQSRETAKEALPDRALFAYDFQVTTLDGQQLRLADLRGKVVIVDYWGTWCPPCRAEVPHFVALKEEFGDKLAIVGMSWEQGKTGADAREQVLKFAKEAGINYALALVGDQDLKAVPKLDAFPTTLFIDKQGRVRAREVGYRELDALRAMVQALDAEPTPAQPEVPGGALGPF